MTNSNEKKKRTIGEAVDKIMPKIYQVRFNKVNVPIRLDSFPALKELGDWLNTSTPIWACHSKLNKKEFEKSFYETTKLTVDDAAIFTGAAGFNSVSPGWRDSL
ncbi:DUF3884 family protein [Carnobacterium mobile]|uniref:DUF3884 family protein n=1 Tax=Carnobacterium mobile TaxID=2750 RepID=UPI0018687FBD|nr:DUF3884 family protein [Carnobacterium mobile]